MIQKTSHAKIFLGNCKCEAEDPTIYIRFKKVIFTEQNVQIFTKLNISGLPAGKQFVDSSL